MPPSARAFGRRIRRRGSALLDRLPLTVRGATVAALAAMALWPFGVGSLDLVLFVVGIAGLVLVALAAVLVTGTTLVLRRRLGDAATEVLQLEAGAPIRTGFRVPRFDAVPLVEMRWVWLEPHGVAVRTRTRTHHRAEDVVATRRCARPQVVRRFTVYDVFGLSRLSWQRTEGVPVSVLPNVGRLRSMPVVQSLSATEGLPMPTGAPEGDRMEIRRYVPGDSPRHILWKTYARTRELNVRLPERSVDRAERTVAYLVTGDGDEPAAAAARVALESGALGDRWVFGADGHPDPVESLDAALDAIARSGDVEATEAGGAGLARFLDQRTRDGGMHCIVFAPAIEGPWIERALEAGQRFTGQLSFVLATDGVAQPTSQRLWRRLLFTPPPASGTESGALNRVVRRLGSAGASAVVVDRASGRAFGETQQRHMGLAS